MIREAQEIEDEEHEQILERVCAVDVAKAAPRRSRLVCFLGPGLPEVSGHAAGPREHSVMIWIQVRDFHAEHARLAAAGASVLRKPATEPSGLNGDVDRGPQRHPHRPG